MGDRVKHEVFDIIKRCGSSMETRILFNNRELSGVVEQIIVKQKRLGAELNFARDKFSDGKYYDRSKEAKYRRKGL